MKINIDSFEGSIPVGYDLVEYEKGENPLLEGMVLYGFDEVESMGYQTHNTLLLKLILWIWCNNDTASRKLYKSL